MQNALFPELDEQEISKEVLPEKYAKGDEKTVTDVRQRVARALAAVPPPPGPGAGPGAGLQCQA